MSRDLSITTKTLSIPDDFSALHKACWNGDCKEVVRILSINPERIDEKESRGLTPLYLAVYQAVHAAEDFEEPFLQVVDFLISSGADFQFPYDERQSVLNALLEDGIFREAWRAAIEKKLGTEILVSERESESPAALKKISLETLFNSDVPVYSSSHDPSILKAEDLERWPEEIIEARAKMLEMDLKDMAAEEAQTITAIALQMRYWEANKIGVDGMLPIFKALKSGNFKQAEAFLKLGADPNKLNRGGSTVLFLAAQDDLTNFVELFLRFGADVNQKVDGMAPLHIAAQEGHKNTVRALLAAPNVDVNIELGEEVENGGRATPLYLAAQEALVETVQIFVADGRAFPKRSAPTGRGFL